MALDRRRFAGGAVALLAAAAGLGRSARAAQVLEDEKAWSALRAGGHVAFVRHALAPGTGDPADFDVADCTTQRNLSEAGRAQARLIGTRFRRAGVERARLYSSQWCRCLETARLFDIGPVEELPALNSFFQRPAERAGRLEALREFLTVLDPGLPPVLVTHQVTISAMTGAFARSGEVLVAELDRDALGSGRALRIRGRVLIDPPG